MSINLLDFLSWSGRSRPLACDTCPYGVLNADPLANQLLLESRKVAKLERELEAAKAEANNVEELNCRQAALEQREQGIQGREQKLNALEQTLHEKELELQGREAAQQAMINRLAAEREQWEAARPTQKQNDIDTNEAIGEVKDAFKDVKEKLVEMINAVKCSDQDGVELLCKLYRDMSVMGDVFADRLGALLQTEFQAEALEPCPGDTYEPEYHERVDFAQSGQWISCCKARGWQRRGQVIMRAVVETEEREGT